MLRFHGIVGLALIIVVEINFVLKIEPLASRYFTIVWVGYILFIDALVHHCKGSSLLTKHPNRLLGMFLISAVVWWLFEFINISLGNWQYKNLDPGPLGNIFMTLAFSTILPALFETVELIKCKGIFSHKKLKKRFIVSVELRKAMIVAGVLCLVAPVLLPSIAFPLVWLGFFLLLDPINYMNKQPSIIGHLRKRELETVLSLLLAGIILGLLWEFWNYWAVPKWTYHVPYVGFFKVFEMPLLGYLGYLPFALELYAIYWFVRSLFLGKEALAS